ncbi:Mavicyanin-like protein [Drosera capensis]
METAKRADVLLRLAFCMIVAAMIALYQPLCRAEVYKVGDSHGWTSIVPHPDYHLWAASKTFHVGDAILFQYTRDFQNVEQVSRAEYKSCSVRYPIATYNSGNDSITIRRPGHYFYLCSLPGHCEAGQKVDFRVRRTRPPPTSPSASPSLSPAPTLHQRPVSAPASAPRIAPGHVISDDASASPSKLWTLLASLLVAAFATTFH